jgi:hypothetical protein
MPYKTHVTFATNSANWVAAFRTIRGPGLLFLTQSYKWFQKKDCRMKSNGQPAGGGAKEWNPKSLNFEPQC